MKIEITLKCPDCSSFNIKENGKKNNTKQNYYCNDCGRQLLMEPALTYNGCNSELKQKIELMLATGVEPKSYS